MIQPIDDSRLSANPFPGFKYPNGEVEYPQHGFTRRERAAIDLRLPDSGTPWLDDMIRAAQRQWLAAQALAGLMVNYNEHPHTVEVCVEIAYNAADAMLAAHSNRAASSCGTENAAPELLEAAKKALRVFVDQGWDDDLEAAKSLQSAIAKYEGGAE